MFNRYDDSIMRQADAAVDRARAAAKEAEQHRRATELYWQEMMRQQARRPPLKTTPVEATAGQLGNEAVGKRYRVLTRAGVVMEDEITHVDHRGGVVLIHFKSAREANTGLYHPESFVYVEPDAPVSLIP